MKKIISGNYIIGISDVYGEDISDEEYEQIADRMNNMPPTQEGYMRKLTRQLEWVYIPIEQDEPSDEATEADYIEAAKILLGEKE